jgi:hypothetical protein
MWAVDRALLLTAPEDATDPALAIAEHVCGLGT